MVFFFTWLLLLLFWIEKYWWEVYFTYPFFPSCFKETETIKGTGKKNEFLLLNKQRTYYNNINIDALQVQQGREILFTIARVITDNWKTLVEKAVQQQRKITRFWPYHHTFFFRLHLTEKHFSFAIIIHCVGHIFIGLWICSFRKQELMQWSYQ